MLSMLITLTLTTSTQALAIPTRPLLKTLSPISNQTARNLTPPLTLSLDFQRCNFLDPLFFSVAAPRSLHFASSSGGGGASAFAAAKCEPECPGTPLSNAIVSNKLSPHPSTLRRSVYELLQSPVKTQMKQVKPRTLKKQEDVVLRRSRRVANKQAPVYNDFTLVRVEITRRISMKRDLSNRVYASDEARARAVDKAEKLEARLGPEHPTFIKSMLQSHVTGGFWLGLPGYFCRRNLPKRDEAITLIDEDGDEYPTIYLPRKTGLSGGWKAFAVAHRLVDGDALVFQLIRITAFKVEIKCWLWSFPDLRVLLALEFAVCCIITLIININRL